MSRKSDLKILYGIIAVIALLAACGGIGIAAATAEWITDNVYRGGIANFEITYWIKDDNTLTARSFNVLYPNGLELFVGPFDEKEVEKYVQLELCSMLGHTSGGYKTNWVQLAVIHENEVLLTSKRTGEEQVDFSVHCLLLGACNGISTKEWEVNNVYTDRGDTLSLTAIYDDKTHTRRELIQLLDVESIDEFETFAQWLIDERLGEIDDAGYRFNWIQVAAEYEDELLLLSQKSGESAIYLSIPSLVDFSTT